MSMPICNVTVTILSASGQPVVGAAVVATLSAQEVYQGLIVPARITGVTGAGGSVVLPLWPNAAGSLGTHYRLRATLDGTLVMPSCRIYVPNVASGNAQDMLLSDDAAPIPVTGPVTSVGGLSGAVTLAMLHLDGAAARGLGESWVSADTSGATGASASIQATMDAASTLFPAGAVVWMPPAASGTATYLIDAQLKQPDNVRLLGVGWDQVTLKLSASLPSDKSFLTNKSTNITNGSLISPGLVVGGFTVDGSARVFPAWLSMADGTPITDPAADYRAGGALAPPSIATAHASIVGGGVASPVLDTPGSGYIYPPTLWITGDGYGATGSVTYAGGVVTGVTIDNPGYGYTTCSLEIAGGGADPRTALYAANRRNANYALNTPAIEFYKADRPRIFAVRFVNYGATTIVDGGCDAMLVEHCEWIDCGQSDFVGNCLWSQSHGSVTTPPAYFRKSTNTVFRFNRIVRQKRSVALFGGSDQVAHNNTIIGWGESAFFFSTSVERPTVRDNFARDGVRTDIVCHFVESAYTPHTTVTGNTVMDVDGPMVSSAGDTPLIAGNVHVATKPVARGTIPFGPFAERVGYNTAQAAVAGTNVNSALYSSSVLILDIDGSPVNAPSSAMVRDHRISDPSGHMRNVVQFSKGRLKSIGPVTLTGIDMTGAPYTALFDPVQADKCLDPNAPFRVFNNPGHTSQGAVVQSATITAGTLGVWKATFGFRPRVLQILARPNNGASAVGSVWFFADDASRNPGNTGATNTTGIGQRWNDNGTARGSESMRSGGMKVCDSSGATVLSASAYGFSSDGWSMQINTSTADVYFDIVATP